MLAGLGLNALNCLLSSLLSRQLLVLIAVGAKANSRPATEIFGITSNCSFCPTRQRCRRATHVPENSITHAGRGQSAASGKKHVSDAKSLLAKSRKASSSPDTDKVPQDDSATDTKKSSNQVNDAATETKKSSNQVNDAATETKKLSNQVTDTPAGNICHPVITDDKNHAVSAVTRNLSMEMINSPFFAVAMAEFYAISTSFSAILEVAVDWYLKASRTDSSVDAKSILINTYQSLDKALVYVASAGATHHVPISTATFHQSSDYHGNCCS